MNITQMITKEEHFTYLVSIGKSKSEAYRTVFPEHRELSPELIGMRAWRYSNKPEVIRLLSSEEDNLYIKYAQARYSALNVLQELATNATSEKVRADAATSLLNQTAKIKGLQLDVGVNIKSEYAEVLKELRATLLGGDHPRSQPAHTEMSESNMLTDFQNPNQIDNCADYKPELTLDGKALTIEILDEQELGINPLEPMDGENRVRARDGKFVSYSQAREMLSSL